MAELKDVFQGVLVKALNLPEAEVSSLFNDDGSVKDDAQDLILNKHADAVSKARDKAKAEREAQLARGRRERGEELEKYLKAAGVELEGATGEEAIEKFKAALEAKAKPSELEEDKVKTSPLYRKLEKDAALALAAKDKELADKLAERDAKDQRERTLSTAKSKAFTILEGMKPVLSVDPEKAKRQLRLLEMDVEAMQFDIEEDGTIFVKDKEGKRIEGANGHEKSFEDFVKDTASQYYDFQVSDKKGSAGDPTKGTVKGAAALKKPASRKEYAEQLNEITNDPTLKPEEKAAKAAELKEFAKDLA